jgi:hypothetical protein
MKDEDDFCNGFDCKVKSNCEKYQNDKGLGIYFPKYIGDNGCKFFVDKKSLLEVRDK